MNPNASARKPISRHSHVYPVIPAQAGIQCVEFQLFRINFETLIASFPRKWESSFFEFQSFPINCLSIECLDSRLRGNDESIHTETCTTSFPRTCTTSFPRTYIPSFPRKWESSSFGFACFKFRVTSTSSFPRRRESSALSFSYLE